MNSTVCEVLNEGHFKKKFKIKKLTISCSHYYHDYNIIIIFRELVTNITNF